VYHDKKTAKQTERPNSSMQTFYMFLTITNGD